MLDFVRRSLFRPFVALWLTFSVHSWRRRVMPHDSPHVRAPGTNADRVLIAGDGAASGRGVVTHELGLPGFLARSLSKRTGRATEVDIVVNDSMTVLHCAEALTARDLSSYDIVVLSTGANEALELQSPREWQIATRALITTARLTTRRETKIFVLGIPQFGVNPHFPRPLCNVVDYHVGMLNTITEQLTQQHRGVVYVPESQEQVYEDASASRYQQWAEVIADRIVRNLDPHRVHAASTADAYEVSRLLAVEHVEALGTAADPLLDDVTEKTRERFGTEIAAVTFLRSETEFVRAASGFEPGIYPRADALCDITIRRSAQLVIEDAARDHRYVDYSVVSGPRAVRFYAGQPIESPDGYRIGALCVMDSRSRRFSDRDAADLRSFALTIQRHLYAAPAVA